MTMPCPVCGATGAPRTTDAIHATADEPRTAHTCGRCLVTTIRLRAHMPEPFAAPRPERRGTLYIPQCSGCGAERTHWRPGKAVAGGLVPSGWTRNADELLCPECTPEEA